jgi:signal transduction histidine kinase
MLSRSITAALTARDAARRDYAAIVRARPTPAQVFDAAVCAALLALGIGVTTSADAGAGTVVDTLLLPTVILPILLRHRAPFAAAAALAAGCVVSGIPTFDQFRVGVAIPAAILILYPLAHDSERPRALAGLGLVLAGMVFVGMTDKVASGAAGVASTVAFAFPVCIVSWGGGRLVRSREQLLAQLAERSELLERRRGHAAALAVEVERTRLASDLDAAARLRVEAISRQAQSGARSLPDQPDAARAAFVAIEHLGRDSLEEMRGLLGILRDDAVDAPRTPHG